MSHDDECAAADGLGPLYEQIQQRINRGEWTVVTSLVGSPITPGLEIRIQYTVGLQAQGLPELVTYGLPVEVGQGLLNDCAARLLAGTLSLDTPVRDLGLQHNLPVMFKEADQDKIKGIFGLVRAFSADGFTARLWQLVWTDINGRFPWEAGFMEDNRPYFIEHYNPPRLLN